MMRFIRGVYKPKSVGNGNNHIAINLGTTNTYLSVLEEGNNHNNNPKIIQKIPSAVQLKSGSSPINTIYGFKRLVGRSFDDPIIQKEIKRNELLPIPLPYKIVRCPNANQPWIETSYGHICSPSIMLERYLKKMKEMAETYLGGNSVVSSAILTFPPNVSALELKATRIAAHNAGLSHGCFIIEPTAAATLYGLHEKKEGSLVAIVDLGGRTLDVSVLERVSTMPCFKLKGPAISDMFLGGEDFDNVLMEYLVSKLGNDVIINKDVTWSAIQRLRQVAEQAKKQLSSAYETEITLPSILPSDASGGDGRDLKITVTRPKFESLVCNLIDRIRIHCHNCLKEAGITAKDIDDVLLVGGMARVPIVEKVVTEMFGKSPSRRGINPDEAVALGAVAAAIHTRCLGLYMKYGDVGFLNA
ncbi:Chaperone protein dnak [Thalictrum thalictroides]|uniref:Chaperone protein dnak n=1 Tax=Thalictrum thalictroides TaxID=46969 RepID=A0A7J6WZR5_THATH|nr:Chaperone protein dnak [Thalictrum thalictroides]